jgi:hypothetical protein
LGGKHSVSISSGPDEFDGNYLQAALDLKKRNTEDLIVEVSEIIDVDNKREILLPEDN